jgi:hypothetical protein
VSFAVQPSHQRSGEFLVYLLCCFG